MDSVQRGPNPAMETAAPWERWKNKLRFSTVPTALGKLAKNVEFPTVSTALLLGLKKPARKPTLLMLLYLDHRVALPS
jgi:hypothetical protein